MREGDDGVSTGLVFRAARRARARATVDAGGLLGWGRRGQHRREEDPAACRRHKAGFQP